MTHRHDTLDPPGRGRRPGRGSGCRRGRGAVGRTPRAPARSPSGRRAGGRPPRGCRGGTRSSSVLLWAPDEVALGRDGVAPAVGVALVEAVAEPLDRVLDVVAVDVGDAGAAVAGEAAGLLAGAGDVEVPLVGGQDAGAAGAADEAGTGPHHALPQV